MALVSDLGQVFVSVLLWFYLFQSAAALKTIKEDTPELTCSQGLTNCKVSSDYPFSENLPETYGSVNVTQVQLTAALCLSASIEEYELCLQITISLQEDVPPEGSGGDDDEEEALIQVCLSYPGSTGIWKALKFNRSYTGLGQRSKHSHHEVVLTVKGNILEFGTPLVVAIWNGILKNATSQNITFPDYEEVCKSKPGGTITKCVVPYLHAEIKHENKVWLTIKNAKHQKGSCLVDWDGISGERYAWAEGESEINISPVFVAPCLCFQAWWDGEDRRGRYCPFKHCKDAFDIMQHNVLVTLAESRMRKDGNGLTWNVTSVCVLQGEVRLCKKDVTGAQCEEVMGSTQKLENSWTKSSSRHWQAGEFSVSKHHLLCVQLKINGMESFSEPQCPFTTSRVRWILPLLIGLMLICLAILGAYLVQGVLKGYVWKWLKEDDVKGAVGGGHVVLLYPSDDDRRLPGMLCHLGSSLQALGFTVSLDLWSQAELSALGPVPWLHSQLDQLQRQGGKVVLVLTKATWTRAEEWGALSNDVAVNRDAGEESYPPSSRRVDVFGASLSCILADYLQGRAGERFMLVQFESLPPEPPDGFCPLPRLFCGLHVYSLPSQSLGFLTELAGTKHMASASARRKRAGGLRKASRALAQKLSGFTAGTNVFRLAGVSQGCVGGEVEDSGETVPLQPALITPPSSPETETTGWSNGTGPTARDGNKVSVMGRVPHGVKSISNLH